MRGEILQYDDGSGSGLISGDDGVRYAFSRADLQQLRPVKAGDRVDFVPRDGIAAEIVLIGAAASAGFSPTTAGAHEYSGENLTTWAYFKKCFSLYVDGNGRARRKEYWSFVLWETVILAPLFLASTLFMAAGETSYDQTMIGAGGLLLLAAGIITLAFILPAIAVTIRRLHDIGLSGWLLLVGLIPYVGGIFIFIVSLIPSQARQNEHGLIPKPPSS